MHQPKPRCVRLEDVLGFVDRTTSRGVPLRVALARAERRFGVERGLIRDFVRSAA